MSNLKDSSSDPEYRGGHDEYLKNWNRRFTQAHLKAVERIKAEKAKQREIHIGKEKIQQQLLTMADLKAQVAAFQNTDNAISTTTKAKANNIVTALSDEQYQTTIVTKMVALIKQRKMK
jgi:N-methylhydantoinase B/oxoprolinase/acetone carboxylase alpha subunit